MKTTGIIRRIDDLGRVVIPKEIRKQLKIVGGEPLEILIDENNNIVLSQRNNRYKLEVWALSDEGEGSISINEIIGGLKHILLCLKNQYRFTEEEEADILKSFKKNGFADYSIELYGLEFYIEKI